jgi:hypothetical protein
MAKRQLVVDPIAAAREVARAEVQRRWPELAGVEPTVAPRPPRTPDHAEFERLGASAGSGPAAPTLAEYTFTFAGHVHTSDGYTLPRVARVTVDERRRVVKATTSK